MGKTFTCGFHQWIHPPAFTRTSVSTSLEAASASSYIWGGLTKMGESVNMHARGKRGLHLRTHAPQCAV